MKKKPTATELENVKSIRKGLIYADNLKAGDTVLEKHILYARPAVNYSSNQVNDVLGKTLSKDVGSGILISKDDFK